MNSFVYIYTHIPYIYIYIQIHSVYKHILYLTIMMYMYIQVYMCVYVHQVIHCSIFLWQPSNHEYATVELWPMTQQ